MRKYANICNLIVILFTVRMGLYYMPSSIPARENHENIFTNLSTFYEG
jgi:hypothetical protein